MNLAVFGYTFAVLFLAELPDKTFAATVVLASRYPHIPVWLGVSSAFAIQTGIAVAAGGLIGLLPHDVVLTVSASLFGIIGLLLVRAGILARGEEEEEVVTPPTHSPLRVAAISFGVLFAAEWGDLSQLTTAGITAKTGDHLSVFLGAWTALAAVSGLAVLLGKKLQSVRPDRLQLISGSVLLVLCALTVHELLGA